MILRTGLLIAAAMLFLTMGCAGTGPAKFSVPANEVAPILTSLAVVPVEFSSQRTRALDREVRDRLEPLPGELLPVSSSDECDEGDWVQWLNKLEKDADDADDANYPDHADDDAGDPVGPVDPSQSAYLECLADEGATAVLLTRLKIVSAPFNLGLAFFCGGSKSIRPVQQNPFATSETSRHQGTLSATCLSVSLYRLNGEKIYSDEAPFATLMRLRSNVSGGIDEIPIETSLADEEVRRDAIDEVVAPLVEGILRAN